MPLTCPHNASHLRLTILRPARHQIDFPSSAEACKAQTLTNTVIEFSPTWARPGLLMLSVPHVFQCGRIRPRLAKVRRICHTHLRFNPQTGGVCPTPRRGVAQNLWRPVLVPSRPGKLLRPHLVQLLHREPSHKPLDIRNQFDDSGQGARPMWIGRPGQKARPDLPNEPAKAPAFDPVMFPCNLTTPGPSAASRRASTHTAHRRNAQGLRLMIPH